MSPSPVHQAIAALLRKSRLLGVADKLLYYRLKRSSLASRERLQSHQGPVALPPDELAYDAYGFLNWEQYWSSGRETARLLSAILLREFSDERQRGVLDWGCGPGRIVRHMPELLRSGKWSVFGTDCNTASVRWCRDNIGGITFTENGLAPPLPHQSQSFDAVYGISVFTHLSEALQAAWAKEIARVLRARGILIASFHGEAARSYLLPSERRLYDRGQPVVRGFVGEGRRTFTTYHPPASVRALLSEEFEIQSRQTSPVPSLGVHDLYIARKRAC